jgi:CO dehydrogenase/acetyl-CoA synthase beta subunit
LAVFDVYVNKIAEYVENMHIRQRQIRVMNPAADVANLVAGLPVRVGKGAQSSVILKEDTCVELGSPRTISCAFLLWTENVSLIRDGRITLIGPDIHESMGQSLPFGQAVVMGGIHLREEYHQILEWGQYVSDRIEGYMTRTVPQRMWSRVSKEAAEKGFCFETLGRALMGISKAKLPIVEAMEILFVTSSEEDVAELALIGKQIEKISREIKRKQFIVGDDGNYVCTTGLDCQVCPDRTICDCIRELITIRKVDLNP